MMIEGSGDCRGLLLGEEPRCGPIFRVDACDRKVIRGLTTFRMKQSGKSHAFGDAPDGVALEIVMAEGTCDIGLIGLAVMGQNLVLNMNDHGYKVAVFNRTTSKVDEFLADEAKGTKVVGTHSVKELCAALKLPRRVMMMVKAGEVVDQTIEQVLPYLEKGDILIDGGNSLFTDTNRRTKELAEKGILFIGTGVSGGEEGARFGPSIMPGGNPAAWPHVKEIFQSIAAKVEGGVPCCDWVGEDGAGHYVKMVHNGIEYGDIQLICEAYQLMKDGLGLTADELHEVFAEWNKGELDSYLIEITAEIFAKKDEDGTPMVDKILDTAGQKGTGKWTAISALDLGMPVTLIGESVFARCLSALKEERVAASKVLQGPKKTLTVADKKEFIEDVRRALYCSKMISYAQGYMLLRAVEKEMKWNLNMGGIALMWRGGCIIRSVFLGNIKAAFDKNPKLQNLLMDDFFSSALNKYQASWRKAIIHAIEIGVPMPAFSTALAFYDGYRCERLPANLLQAQRDFFGAHTYERVDKPRGEFFHTNWTGRGGKVSSSTYNA
jgi:6-phosphogluconate dehydrogenase